MIKEKRESLIKYTIETFESRNPENVAVNARKTMEAFCKLIILHHYGEADGEEIIFSKNNEVNDFLKMNPKQKKQKFTLVLNMLCKVILQHKVLNKIYQKQYEGTMLSQTIRSRRTWLQRNIEYIIFCGNSSAHEDSFIPITSLSGTSCQNMLSELLIWLHSDVLKKEVLKELIPYIGHYDIFVSYRHTNNEWVELLVENLQMQGYSIFIDSHQLMPGDNVEERLYNAIQKSSYGIVIYPEEDESGWINQELSWMQEQMKRDSNFKIIPLLMTNSIEIPNQKHVYADFKTKEYVDAFNDLLSGIEGLPPTSNHIKNQESLKLPKETYNLDEVFVKETVETLKHEKLVVLFSQDYANVGNYLPLLKNELKEQFKEGFLEVFIPVYEDAEKYFTHISKSCGIENTSVAEVQEWKDAMQKKLADGKSITLFVNDLENGKGECNHQFAMTIRSLCEQCDLKVLLIGRKKLASLVYEHSTLSPLNTAKKIFFPDTYVNIKEEEIDMEFEKYRDKRDQLLAYLEKKDKIRRYSPWCGNPIINELFWRNFIVKYGRSLVWRSDEVREIGLEVLSDENI